MTVEEQSEEQNKSEATVNEAITSTDQNNENEAENEQDKVKPVIYIGLTLTLLFSLGCYDVFFKLEPNHCSMTYMYEMPQYVTVPMTQQINNSFPKYNLVVYGEGEGKRTSNLQKNKFSGIPVLFIPGNAGSVKQVRSLASVALRKSIEDYKYKVHFDYFSVDFDEEWSAFYGGTLEKQTQYVIHCINKILSLYKNNEQNNVKSVVLVGHSMGGVIAKAVMMYPDQLSGPSTVPLIINLATPVTPVLVMDKETQVFYDKVTEYWKVSRPQDLSLVSIAGGLRDIQVRAGLTVDPSADINTVTDGVPGGWVSADHKCIVWCRQVVLAINRAMFDMITPVTKQITLDKSLRDNILRYHLVQRPWGKKYNPDDWKSGLVSMDKGGYWADILPRQFTLDRGNVTRDHYNMIKVVSEDINQRMLTLDAVHMEADHWVYGCKRTELQRNSRVCVESESISSSSVILPSKGKRKLIQLDMMEMEEAGYSHIVVNIPKNSDNSRINVDLYNPRERSVTYSVPKWINFWRQMTVIDKTVAGAVYYNLTLSGLEQPWQSYVLTINPIQCRTDMNIAKPHYGLARFITPWSSDVSYTLLAGMGQPSNLSSNSITARLQTTKPINNTDVPRIDLFLDPSCQYNVKIYPSIVSMMGQMVRYYSQMLLPSMTAVSILILAFQFRRIESDRFCQSTIMTLITAVSPINVVLPSKMVAYVLTQLTSVDTDINIVQARGLDFGVLPIMMFFISIGLMFIVASAGWMMILAFGSLAHKAVMRWMTRATPHELVADVAVSTLSKFPSILACLLIALASATCGSLALCLGCFCYFLKLFKMYQDYLEGLVKRAVGLRDEDDPAILLGVSFQFSLAILWLLHTCLHFPVLITWTQNVAHMSPQLAAVSPDPSFLPAVVCCLSLVIIWQNDGQPKVEKKYFSIVAIIMQGLAICIATFSMISIYRLSYIITAVFVVVAFHQAFSPDREPEPEDEDNKDITNRADTDCEGDQSDMQRSQASSQDVSAAESDSELEFQNKVRKRKIVKSASGGSCITETDTGFQTESNSGNQDELNTTAEDIDE